MSTKAKKPKTNRERSAYYCQLQCKLVRDSLDEMVRTYDRKAKRGIKIEHALFWLAGAISELSQQMEAK